MENTNRHKILNSYDSFGLDELNAVALLTRYDTKFIFNDDKLDSILNVLVDSYNILELNNLRIFKYDNLYYDIEQLKLFLDHHNNKIKRYKIRFREYADSKIVFFEIKLKINNYITEKYRIKTDNIQYQLDSLTQSFLEDIIKSNTDGLKPALGTFYNRITLLHKTDKHKITIDSGLHFKNNNEYADLPRLAVLELKQTKYSKTDIERLVNKVNGLKMRFSKYVHGTLLTNDSLKYNNLKLNVIKIKKVSNGKINS